MDSATPIARPPCVLLLCLSLAFAGCGKPVTSVAPTAEPEAVTALGRVVPGRAVVSVAASPGERVDRLLVKEHDKVQARAQLAYLATHDVRVAELAEAETAVAQGKERLKAETDLAQARIDQAVEGLKIAETNLSHELTELHRVESLHSAEAVPGHSLDDQTFLVANRKLEVARAKAELEASKASLASVRTQVGLPALEARLATAEASLELSIIRAPISGEVLKVLTYPGEKIGNAPILQLGDTSDMHVIAEVHEMDVGRVKVGQSASITSDAFAQALPGVVDEVGALIYKNDVLDVDPRANTDTRVVEVRIKVKDPASVAMFSNLETHVRIDVTPPTGPKAH